MSELHEIRTALKVLTAKPKDPLKKHRRSGSRNLLTTAAFGKSDALQTIKGVGPKLERLLHGIGVYYFWQIDEWDRSDVLMVDDLLEVFKGRIERDRWVDQAGLLKSQSGAAAKPA